MASAVRPFILHRSRYAASLLKTTENEAMGGALILTLAAMALPVILFIAVLVWLSRTAEATKETSRRLILTNTLLQVLVAERYPHGVPEPLRQEAERTARCSY